MHEHLICPECGARVVRYRNPVPTVDIIIRDDGDRIVLIERRNPPTGWALPGGFVDYGESLETAAASRSSRGNRAGTGRPGAVPRLLRPGPGSAPAQHCHRVHRARQW